MDLLTTSQAIAVPVYDDSYRAEQRLRRVDSVQVLLFMHPGTFLSKEGEPFLWLRLYFRGQLQAPTL